MTSMEAVRDNSPVGHDLDVWQDRTSLASKALILFAVSLVTCTVLLSRRIPRGRLVAANGRGNLARRGSIMMHEHGELMNDIELSHEERVKAAWVEQQKGYDLLCQLKAMTPEQLFGRDKLALSVSRKPSKSACIDEGAVFPGEPHFGIAGNGVLLTEEEFPITIKKMKAQELADASFHECCGACDMFCAEHKLPKTDSLNIGKKTAADMLEAIGSDHRPLKLGFGKDADYQMQRPSDFHIARAIYVDGTGRFYREALGLPKGFFHSPVIHPSLAYTAKEVSIALSIANGPHGFNGRFQEQPIALVLIGDEKNPELNVAALEKAMADLIETHGHLIELIRFPVDL